MEIGKMPADRLEKNILNKIGHRRDDILVHAGIGEDSAVVDFGEDVLVISSDPITGANKQAGYLAVHVACNDLAATGAEPIGIQVVLLLPPCISGNDISDLMEEIDETASSINVDVLGGHTETLSFVSKPIIIITAIGKTKKDRYIPTGGALPGDDLILTKGVGIEGTYILANDYEDILKEKGISPCTITKAKEYGKRISVLQEGLIAARAGAHAMHDVTEGGLYGALEEMARASGTGFNLYLDRLVVNPETREIADVLGIDPAGLISSGSMLIAIPDGKQLIKDLNEVEIKAFEIGEVIKKGYYIWRGEDKRKEFTWSKKDELWRLMEENSFFS